MYPYQKGWRRRPWSSGRLPQRWFPLRLPLFYLVFTFLLTKLDSFKTTSFDFWAPYRSILHSLPRCWAFAGFVPTTPGSSHGWLPTSFMLQLKCCSSDRRSLNTLSKVAPQARWPSSFPPQYGPITYHYFVNVFTRVLSVFPSGKSVPPGQKTCPSCVSPDPWCPAYACTKWIRLPFPSYNLYCLDYFQISSGLCQKMFILDNKSAL